MTTATPNQIDVTITESLSSEAKVDRENGIVRNVKLIGFKSKNGRNYPPPILKRAVHLYEGSKVNFDHPEQKPSQPRKYADRFGLIRSAHFVEGKGIYGDLHYNPEHPNANQFAWDVENSPSVMGFSHNATLKVSRQRRGGNDVVEEVVRVRSMDIVPDPATTDGIFEHQETDDYQESEMAKIEELQTENAELKQRLEQLESKQESDELESIKQQNADLVKKVEGFEAKEKERELMESIDEALESAGLDKSNETQVSKLFLKQLAATESETDRLEVIQDRAELLKVAPKDPKQTRTKTTKPVYKPATEHTEALEGLDAKGVASRLLSS